MESYFVVGPDGTEYGPATLDQLKQWQSEARIGPATQLKLASTGAFVPASQVLGTTTSAIPPVGPQFTVGATPRYNPSTPAAHPYDMPNASAKGSNRTVGWLIAGVVGCGLCIGVPAATLYPVFTRARQSAKSVVALSEGRNIALAVVMYANDKGNYPDLSSPATVAQAVGTYVRSNLAKRQIPKFSFNSSLSQKTSASLKNASDVWLLKSDVADSRGRTPLCFADGRCKLASPTEVSSTQNVVPQFGPETPGTKI